MLAAGLVLVAGAGAGTTPAATPAASDLSSLTEIKSYLRSIGVNPKSVVIQRGKKNYAGPNCPGKGWSCTTRTRVLQVGSVNSFECSAPGATGGTSANSGGTQTCVGFMQSGDRNRFRCIQRTSQNPAVQACGVTQTGVSNYALVEQVADLSGELEQDATQTADVEQNGSGKNEVHIHQRVKEATSAGIKQDSHQVAIVDQDATGSAKNFSDVHQYSDLRASGGTNQLQNTEPLPGGVTDCAGLVPPDAFSPVAPNECANIRQTAETAGGNLSHLHQLIDEDAKSSTATNQDQGTFDGGIDSDVHQEITGGGDSLITVVDGSGSSESHANQARRQNVVGPENSDQDQVDPTRCCGVSQKGGRKNREDIKQGGSQNSNANGTQSLLVIGECNTENGSCVITHHVRNDDDHESYNCGSNENDPCVSPVISECESADLLEADVGDCSNPDDPVIDVVGIFTESSLLPGTPLSGYEVTMGLVAPDLSFFP
jgi:hypothetical protein